MNPPTSERRGSIFERLPSDDTFIIDRFPYAFLLASNDIPSSDTIAEIKAFLVEPTEQLRQMEAEIAFLQDRLDSLPKRHAALKNQVEACRSVITMPRCLPEDILLEIFFQCLPDANSPTLDGTTPPFLLTAVCRRWRVLALQTPRLWSAIGDYPHVDAQSWRQGRYQKYFFRMLPEWLARSGNRPLTLTVVTQASANVHQVIAEFLDILLPHAFRWKNILLQGPQSSSTVSTLPPSTFQTLESLFLDMSDQDDERMLDDDFLIPISILNAPNLRKVSIQHYLCFDPSAFPLPWDRLTHLDLGGALFEIGPDIGPLSTVLNLCMSLIYLGLDIDQYGEDVSPMYLPNLRKISLRQHVRSKRSHVPRLFVEKLCAPSLQHISIRNFDNETFLSILSQNGRSIQSLDFNTEHIQVDALGDALRHCHSLLNLSIIHLDNDFNPLKADKKFFDLFNGDDLSHTEPLCPLLQEVTFDNVCCDTLTSLTSFLEKKQSTLKKLSIESVQEDGQSLSKEVVKNTLKPFIDSGLQFEMWNHHRPYVYGGSKTDFFGFGYGSQFQYADCWSD